MQWSCHCNSIEELVFLIETYFFAIQNAGRHYVLSTEPTLSDSKLLYKTTFVFLISLRGHYSHHVFFITLIEDHGTYIRW